MAAFSVEQWRDEVLDDAAVEIPDEVLPGGTAAERRAAYAQMLYRAAELRYPTRFAGGAARARSAAWAGLAASASSRRTRTSSSATSGC